jgi:orotidine-5'-phosphate decarboxylase
VDRRSDCTELLAGQLSAGRHLVVGLDPDPARIPTAVDPSGSAANRVVAFNREIVEATAELACAYKPNAAFYEALGEDGFAALAETIAAIRAAAPEAPVILDAKRADIGSTNAGYVSAAFDQLGADAITVHPYLGREALKPFLARREKLIFVLARTSNPGAGELQDLDVGGLPLYRHVARTVASGWNGAGNCGLVVGATYPEEMRLVREDVPPSMPILVPGVGAQGGDVAAVVAAHREVESNAYLIAASRAIVYASSSADFAAAAHDAATSIDAEIRAAETGA